MPRVQRICFPGALYHVFQRGNNKQDIFVDDIDRWHILKLFLEAKKEFGYLLYCYVLMKNHFHMTIETPNATPISKIMQYVQSSYAIYFNNRHKRKGHLFQGRFRDIIVEKDSYLLELSRYVHLNPVRAGLVKFPEEYRWSSYRIYLGTQKDVLVDTINVFSYFDMNNEERSQKEYKNFVESAIPLISNEKDWLEANLFRRRFLGTSNFIKSFHKRGLTPTPKGSDPSC